MPRKSLPRAHHPRARTSSTARANAEHDTRERLAAERVPSERTRGRRREVARFARRWLARSAVHLAGKVAMSTAVHQNPNPSSGNEPSEAPPTHRSVAAEDAFARAAATPRGDDVRASTAAIAGADGRDDTGARAVPPSRFPRLRRTSPPNPRVRWVKAPRRRTRRASTNDALRRAATTGACLRVRVARVRARVRARSRAPPRLAGRAPRRFRPRTKSLTTRRALIQHPSPPSRRSPRAREVRGRHAHRRHGRGTSPRDRPARVPNRRRRPRASPPRPLPGRCAEGGARKGSLKSSRTPVGCHPGTEIGARNSVRRNFLI